MGHNAFDDVELVRRRLASSRFTSARAPERGLLLRGRAPPTDRYQEALQQLIEAKKKLASGLIGGADACSA
jgi:hypothetical protein